MRTLQTLFFLSILMLGWQTGLAQEDRVRQRGRQQNDERPARTADNDRQEAVYGSVTGRIVTEDQSRGLENAVVVIEGSAKGDLTDLRGYFTINNIEPGKRTLKINYIGYTTQTIEVEVKAGETAMIPDLVMQSEDFGVDDIEVLAQLAVPQKTPVAVSKVDRVQIQQRGAQQEVTEFMKLTPSVYTSRGGGGFGDSRITLRGFQQEEIAVLINGIPINDMNAGRVFWSNWAGMGDILRTMQVQRGLGATRLAINSVGGTINMVTKTTDMEKGGFVTAETGSIYNKVTVGLNTGRMDNGLSASFIGSRSAGDGYIDQTYVDAWSYFFSLSKEFGDRNLLTFYIFGAPQEHSQRLYQQSFGEVWDEKDNTYNPNWGYWNGQVEHERVNFYHKPQTALQHSFMVNESGKLVTSVYGSWGRGGGSGTLSDTDLDGNRNRLTNDPNYNDQMNFDAFAANNVNGIDTAFVYDEQGQVAEVIEGNRAYSILRNSWNNHNWYGIMSVYEQGIGDNFKITGGIDGRVYNSEHYRDVRNLLGGDYYIETGYDEGQTIEFVDQDGNTEQIENGRIQYKGDKVAYHYETSIDYLGAFASGEYESDALSAYLSGAISNSWYQRTEIMSPQSASILEDGSPQVESDVLSFLGYTAKAGVNFKIGDYHNIFANGGYFERPPYFRFVYVNSRSSHETVEDPVNEKVTSAELGYGLNLRNLNLNVNGYYTLWDDKGFRVPATNADGSIDLISLPGISATHMGVELEFEAKFLDQFTLSGQLSVGDWRWTNNVEGTVLNEETLELDTVRLFLNDVRVGDAAQTTATLGLRWQPTPWFYTIADVTYFDNLYANFSPEARDEQPVDDQGNSAPPPQPWELPSYTLLDLHAGFTFPMGDKLKGQLRLSLINALDTEYIMEAQDGIDHNRASSRGFYGFGRNYNIALQINF